MLMCYRCRDDCPERMAVVVSRLRVRLLDDSDRRTTGAHCTLLLCPLCVAYAEHFGRLDLQEEIVPLMPAEREGMLYYIRRRYHVQAFADPTPAYLEYPHYTPGLCNQCLSPITEPTFVAVDVSVGLSPQHHIMPICDVHPGCLPPEPPDAYPHGPGITVSLNALRPREPGRES